MSLSLAALRHLQRAQPKDAWAALMAHAWAVCSPGLVPDNAPSEVARRDRAVGAADLFLATAAWDLWGDYEAVVDHTADALAEWWAATPSGRAVLILDALSLRETPWLLQGAKEHGYVIHQARTTGAELPADTTQFAKALGTTHRGALQNNGAGGNFRLDGAVTETLDLPYQDCTDQITAAADWVLWHQWPDSRLHELGGPGHGVNALTAEAAVRLRSAEFWGLVHRLTTGRRLVVTADHGYAASGLFPDTSDPSQAQHLKDRYKSGRWADEVATATGWVPPIEVALTTRQGTNSFALGRRKWKSQGGYPTLTHGGLSLLEVTVPFIELSRPMGV